MFATGDEALLGIVGDVRRKDGVDSAPFPIGTNHRDPGISGLNQGIQQRLHALVKQAIPFDCPVLLIKTFKLCDWKVPEEDGCAFRLFTTCILANVPNGDVDRPPLFIARKLRQVCFI